MSRNHNNQQQHYHQGHNGSGGGPPAQRIAKMSLASYIVDRTPRRAVDARDASNMTASSTGRSNNNHHNNNSNGNYAGPASTYGREAVRAKLAAYHRAHRVGAERLRELAAKNAGARATPFRRSRQHDAVTTAAFDQLRKSHEVRTNEMLLNYVTYYRPPNRLDDDQLVTNVWSYDEERRGIVYEFDGASGWQRCSPSQMSELVSYIDRQYAANMRIRETNEQQRLLAIQATNLQRQQQQLLRRQQAQQQPLFDPLPLAQQILRAGPSPFGLPAIGMPNSADMDNFLAVMQFHGLPRGGRFAGHPPPPSNNRSLVVSPPMHRPQPQRGRPSFLSQNYGVVMPRHRDSSRVKYDSNSDGFFYDCSSAEMWFRRQPKGAAGHSSVQRPPSVAQLPSPPVQQLTQQPWSGAMNFVADTQASQFLNDFSGLGLHNNIAIGQMTAANHDDDHLLMSQSAPTEPTPLVHCVHGAPMALAFCCVPPVSTQPNSSLLPNGTSRVVGHHRRGNSSDLSAYNSASTTTVNSSLSDSPPPPPSSLLGGARRPQQLQLAEQAAGGDSQHQMLSDMLAFAERLKAGALTPPTATSSTLLDFFAEHQRTALHSETSAEDAFEYDPSASDTENMMVDFVLKPIAFDDDSLGVNPESSLADLMTTPTSSMPAVSRNVLKPIQRPNIIDVSSEEKNAGSSHEITEPPLAASAADWWSPMAPSAFSRSIWAAADEPSAVVAESSARQQPSENQAPAENFYSYFGPDPFYRNLLAVSQQFI